MILYTVMPPEVVWAEAAAAETYEGVVDAGRQVLLARGADGTRRVVRLSSTEPRDFLDARWQPGRPW